MADQPIKKSYSLYIGHEPPTMFDMMDDGNYTDVQEGDLLFNMNHWKKFGKFVQNNYERSDPETREYLKEACPDMKFENVIQR